MKTDLPKVSVRGYDLGSLIISVMGTSVGPVVPVIGCLLTAITEYPGFTVPI